MADIGSAYLSIYPSMDGFAAKLTSELNGINVSSIGDKLGDQLGDGISDGMKKATSSSSGFSAGLSALAGAAGGVASELAGRLFDAVVGLSGEMIEASDSSQKFASTLSFAGIDTSTIDALTKSTQEYADQTVYDLADIRNVTAQLASNGVDNYAQLAEAAGNLNAVAGGSSDTFKSVSMVMSQTAGQGKLVTENWNQLTDAIPGASGALQQAMLDAGAFSGNFREAMEDGEISADEFFAAVQKLGMQDVAIEAATSTSTIEGALGNLQASVVGVGSQAIDAIKPQITGVINMLTDVVTGIPSAFQTAFSAVSGVVGQFTENLSSFETEIGGTATAADVAWVAIQTFGQMLGLSAEQLMPFSDAISSVFDTVQSSISSIQSTIQPYIDGFVSSLGGLATAFTSNILPAIQSFITYITTFANTIMTLVTPVIQTIGPMVVAIATQIVNGVTQIVGFVLPAITNIYNTMTQVLNALIPVVLPIINAILSAFQTAFPAIQSAVSGAMTVISSVIQTVLGVVQGIVSTVLAFIQGDWDGVMNGLSSIASTVWNGIQGVISGVITAVQGIISAALSFIQSLWSSAWNSISSFLSGAWEAIKSGVSSGIDAVLGFFRDLPGNILSALGNLGSLLLDAGSSIIDGLLSGMQSAAEGLFGWVGGIADTIASLKGPLPYDRKLLIPAGNAIMEGLLNGLAEGFGDVTDEVSGMAGAISDELSSGIKSQAYDLGTVGYSTEELRNRAMWSATATPADTISQKDAQSAAYEAVADALSTMGVYLDSDKLVGGISRQMNRSLGRIQRRGSLA